MVGGCGGSWVDVVAARCLCYVRRKRIQWLLLPNSVGQGVKHEVRQRDGAVAGCLLVL